MEAALPDENGETYASTGIIRHPIILQLGSLYSLWGGELTEEAQRESQRKIQYKVAFER